MFETSTPPIAPRPAAQIAALPLRTGRFPLELETEFTEMQAKVPAGGWLPAMLGAVFFFHLLLLAERSLAGLPTRDFVLRGGPVTFFLLAYLLLPVSYRKSAAGRTFLVCFMATLPVALLAGVPFAGAAQLLLVQTGLALLLLFVGWLTVLSRFWTFALSAGMLLASAGSLLLGPAVQSAGMPALLESFWGPGFAAALLLLLAGVRDHEARRDFLLLRQAAFAGMQSSPVPESVHHDTQTHIANRAAFDLRFRAAWDNAAARRSSMALLFFSIDNLPEHKRDLGFKGAELLQAQIAGLLKESLRRADDMVARFDNQHFVVMLPGVGVDGSSQIAERLRGCIEEMSFFAGQKRHRATVTVGVASIRAKRGTPREQLMEGAVQALEQARATGSNVVCVEGRGCIPRMS